MIKNHFKIALRNLVKNKTFSLLNVVGLSVAFAVAILLGMAALFELSYDKFHEKFDSTYQLYTVEQFAEGPEVSVSNPEPMASSLKEEVPGIEHITRHLSDDVLVINNDSDMVLDGAWVNPSFFSIFSFPVVEGNPNPLSERSEVAITQRTAQRLFGDNPALGKTISILIRGEEKPFIIASILKDIPENSSLDFDIAIQFENHREFSEIEGDWSQRTHEVYLTLENSISPETFERGTVAFSESHYQEEIANAKRDGALPDENGNYRQLRLFPFHDSAFATYDKGTIQADKSLTYLIFGVALLILFIACVNFINMSIAKSVQRLKEIGMRKTLGAPKKQLFLHLWSESLIVFVVSAGIGFLLSQLLLDSFKSLFNTDVALEDFASLHILLFFIVGILFITFIAGGYPAVVMTRIGTIQALKGKWDAIGKNKLRNALIVVQFCISILFISGTLVLWKQMDYMRTKDLGYDKDYVISVPLNGKSNSYQVVDLLRNELRNEPSILGVSGADNNLGYGRDGSVSRSILGFDHKGRSVKTNMLVVDPDYVETLDIELTSGRSFDRKFTSDSLTVVINEAMEKNLKEENPLETVIMLSDTIPYKVIGVVKDYHFEELDVAIAPITLFMNPTWDLYYAYVRIAPNNLSASYDIIEKAWNKIEPGAEFLGSFLNENVDRTFRREQELTTMITSGSVIAIVLSCIGLFAISLLVVTQRTKEIGIRRVIGASVSSLTYLLTKDFLKLVLLGFILASPLAWWLANNWLQDYAYRTQLSLWMFIAPGAIALFIALLTIGAKTISAAGQNPTKSLRTE